MPTLYERGAIYYARFHHNGRTYWRSLKTSNRRDAEQTLRDVLTSLLSQSAARAGPTPADLSLPRPR